MSPLAHSTHLVILLLLYFFGGGGGIFSTSVSTVMGCNVTPLSTVGEAVVLNCNCIKFHKPLDYNKI